MTTTTDDGTEVLSPTVAAKRLGIHVNTLRRYTRKGAGPKAVVLGPGRIGYEVSELRAWLKRQQEATAVYEPPSFEERQTVGLEVVAMIDAARERDFGKLAQLTHASNIPVWKHAVEAFVQAAWVIEHVAEFNNPDEATAALRHRIATEAD